MVTRAKIVTFLIGLVAIGNVGWALFFWAFMNSPAVTDGLGVLVGLVTLAAQLMFLWWMHTARDNVEHLGPHRRSRVWTLWGWVVPVIEWWFPKQVMDDIWRATDPHGSRRLVTEWWAAWLAMQFFYYCSLAWETFRESDVVGLAWLNTGYAIFTVVAAVPATKVVQRVTAMQQAAALVGAT